MTNRKKTSLANRLLKLMEKGRAIYKKKDEVFQQLLDACPAGTVIETKEGKYEIVDNFGAKNVGYRPASFHRYELKEHKPLPTKPGKKAAPVEPVEEVLS